MQLSSSQTATSTIPSILMNRTLRYLLLLALALAVMPRAHAQGLVKFNNRVIGAVVAPVYGTNPVAPTMALCGNATTNGGIQDYTGYPLVFGTIYTAQLWGGPLGSSDAALTLAATTTFLTNATSRGFIVAPTSAVAITSVPAGSLATVQLRVWDNKGGTVSNWAGVLADPTVARGACASFTVGPLGTNTASAPNLTNLVSLNLHLPDPTPPVALLDTNTVWRYLDDGSDQGTAWRGAGFDDSSWLSGAAPLGYGLSSITTTQTAGRVTYYHRRAFTVANPAAYSDLVVRLRRDDGGIVYLNNVEVFRSNMPTGNVNFLTLATVSTTGSDQFNYFSNNVSPSVLVAGVNQMAVEIHQAGTNSVDAAFALELIGGVSVPPVITQQPQSLTVTQGQTATFTVAATGTPPPTYQWFRDGVPVPGGSNDELTIDPVQLADNGSVFKVVVSNPAGSVESASATLTVIADTTPPTLVSATADCASNKVTVTFSERVSVDALATGSSALDVFNYQISAGVTVLDAIISPDGRTVCLFVDALAAGITYTLTVDSVTDLSGNTIAANSQTNFNCPTPPVITQQPTNQIVAQGQTATFSVLATGTAPLTYQWRLRILPPDFSVVIGATNAYFNINNAQPTNAVAYDVVIANAFGSVTSQVATLTVNAALVLNCASNKTIVCDLMAAATNPPLYNVLRNFSTNGIDGQKSRSGLVEGTDGALYGTAYDGGAGGFGAVFTLNKDGTGYRVLRSFSTAGTSGRTPHGGLVEGTDGWLYGTTTAGSGGFGNVFKLTPDGSNYTVLHSFVLLTNGVDGQAPYAGVVEGRDGALYGTTSGGGDAGRGTVFKLNTDGSGHAVLRSFTTNANDGDEPWGALVEGRDGALYGTTRLGGTNGSGTVFKLNRDGSGYTVLRRFTGTGGDGARPYGKLVEGTDGAIYGTTQLGGTGGRGTVFKLNKDGSGYTVLRRFSATGGDGGLPNSGLVEGRDGVMYGTCYDGGSEDRGSIFRLNPDGTGYTVLRSFTTNSSDARRPFAGLVEGRDGVFYGVTERGGTNGVGAVFKLELPCSLTFDPPTVAAICCGGDNVTLTVLSTVTNGPCRQYITRTWQATDCCSNTTTCSQTVTLIDGSCPPVILDQPLSRVVTQGQGATFSVIATGAPPLTYQWRFAPDGTAVDAAIPGATNATLVLSNVQSANAGFYFVVVSSAFGVTRSAEASLGAKSGSGTKPDLYIRDQTVDDGTEANNTGLDPWLSPDIWVRQNPDPNYDPYPFTTLNPTWIPAAHENAEWRDPKFSHPNYVYVRIHNKTTAIASLGTERLRVYFAKAGTALAWPADWVDSEGTSCLDANKPIAWGMEITKPRRNIDDALNVPQAAINAYRDAIIAIGTNPRYRFPANVGTQADSYFDKQDRQHEHVSDIANNRPVEGGFAHGNGGFLPWHREYMNRYEVLLREAKPTLTLLYWNWTTDPRNSTRMTGLLGGFNGAIGAPFNVLALPNVQRFTGAASGFTAPTTTTTDFLITSATATTYAIHRSRNENNGHNHSHVFLGGPGGNMGNSATAAEDPIFFMLHANADRLWAQWQRKVISRFDKDTAYPQVSGSTETLYTRPMAPWNGLRYNGTSGESIPAGTIVPWTSAAGDYTYEKPAVDDSVVFPPVYDSAMLTIPKLQPGESVVIQIPWYPPNPDDFNCVSEPSHFCLVARIEPDPAAPLAMRDEITTPEGSWIGGNVIANNNIAWRNLEIFDACVGCKKKQSSVHVRNTHGVATSTTLELRTPVAAGRTLLDFGTVTVDLGANLFAAWSQGGLHGEGVQYLGGMSVRLTSQAGFLRNLRLVPQQLELLTVEFDTAIGYPSPNGELYHLDITQRGSPYDPNRAMGGQRFTADLNKLPLVKPGAVWKYHDTGTNLGTAWRAPGYDDSSWGSGPAELGFGDFPATVINGGPATNRHPTIYFRHAFNVEAPALYTSLLLRLQRDDGAAVYLNGMEIYRINLPAGAIAYSTLATRAVGGLEEATLFPINVTAALPLLVSGGNVLAVEIHQSSPGSSDLSFALELCANVSLSNTAPALVFTTPAAGTSYLPGQPIAISVEALDVDGVVSNVTFYGDGVSLGQDSASPYTAIWNNAGVGRHLLTAVAVDNQGGTGTLSIAVNVVSNLPPVVTLLAPSEGATFSVGEAITMSAAADDTGGSVNQVEFFVAAAHTFGTPQSVGMASAAPYSVAVQNLAAGTYMLTAVATDNGGMVAFSQTVHFTVEGPPTLSITLDGTNLTICWPQGHHDYELQETGNLNPPIAWVPVALPTNSLPGGCSCTECTCPPPCQCGTSASTNCVTIQIGSGTKFFRLAQKGLAAARAEVRGSMYASLAQGGAEQQVFAPGVTVYLTNRTTGTGSGRVLTDGNGRFAIPPMPAGTYELCWMGPGLVSECSTQLVVLAGESIARLPELVTPAPRVIFGQVLGADGLPCARQDSFFGIDVNTRVSLLLSNGAPAASVVADSAGGYYLSGVAPGSYRLRAECEGAVTEQPIQLSTLMTQVNLTLSNASPRIRAVLARVNGRIVQRVAPGTQVQLTVEADDADGDTLHYVWLPELDDGSFASTDSSTVVWQAPDGDGVHSMYVRVHDGKGGYATDKLLLSTAPMTLFSGRVLGSDGPPIVGALVTVKDQFALTDTNGSFMVAVAEDSDSYVLNIEKPGYGLFSEVFDGEVTDMTLVLRQGVVISFNPASSVTLSNVTGPPVRIELEANSLVNAQGSLPVGPLFASLNSLDPCQQDTEVPGDSLALDTFGEPRALAPMAVLDLRIRDAAGNVFNLATGRTATIRFSLGSSCNSSNLPDLVPTWTYNPQTGLWLQGPDAMHVDPPQAAGKGFTPSFHLTLSYAVSAATISSAWALSTGTAPPISTIKVTVDKNINMPIRLRVKNLTANTTTTVNLSTRIRSSYQTPLSQMMFEALDFSTGNPIPGAALTVQAPAASQSINVTLTASHPVGGPFLEFSYGSGSAATAAAYYLAIDPGTTKGTLAAWKTANGFNQGQVSEAIYFNEGDLGFGRWMFMKKQNNGDVAYYVSNYRTADAAVYARAQGHPNYGLLATVAMEYSPHPNNSGARYTKFYVFNSQGARTGSADLDGNGLKYVPNLCQVCHGGDNSGNAQGNYNTKFIPFDLESFKYSSAASFTRAAQEPALKDLNNGVLMTGPTLVASDLVTGWYATSTTFKDTFVPSGWLGNTSGNLPKAGLYDQVIKASCRACHSVRDSSSGLNFRTYANFDVYNSSAKFWVCTGRRMPNAQRTYNNFWKSSGPRQIDVLKQHFPTWSATCP